jgi:hypothetical protein
MGFLCNWGVILPENTGRVKPQDRDNPFDGGAGPVYLLKNETARI